MVEGRFWDGLRALPLGPGAGIPEGGLCCLATLPRDEVQTTRHPIDPARRAEPPETLRTSPSDTVSARSGGIERHAEVVVRGTRLPAVDQHDVPLLHAGRLGVPYESLEVVPSPDELALRRSPKRPGSRRSIDLPTSRHPGQAMRFAGSFEGPKDANSDSRADSFLLRPSTVPLKPDCFDSSAAQGDRLLERRCGLHLVPCGHQEALRVLLHRESEIGRSQTLGLHLC